MLKNKVKAIDLAIQRGIPKNQLFLQYQPIIKISDASIYAAETFIRWNHPMYGYVKPADWLPKVAKSGALAEILLEFINECVSNAKTLAGPILSFNLSCYELNNVECINSLCKSAVQAEGRIAAEIYELDFDEDLVPPEQGWPFVPVENFVECLTQLDESGIQIWVDDYGARGGAKHTLNHPLVDVVKLDMSVLWEARKGNPDDLVSYTQVGHQHGKLMLIERVESKADFDIVKAAGIDLVQGFYFSRALHFADFKHLLASR